MAASGNGSRPNFRFSETIISFVLIVLKLGNLRTRHQTPVRVLGSAQFVFLEEEETNNQFGCERHRLRLLLWRELMAPSSYSLWTSVLFLFSTQALFCFGQSCCDPADQLSCSLDGGLWNSTTCVCSYKSPIIVDIAGDGIALTNVANGVEFDFFGNNQRSMIAWTERDSDAGFLVLDRNENGIIDDATELFGNVTSQPPSLTPNGFAALAVFDSADQGGNEDGSIDARDAVFPKLRIWIDRNHNGEADAQELSPLKSLHIQSFSIRYQTSKVTDEFGNVFRYRAHVRMEDGSLRWAADVFLTSE